MGGESWFWEGRHVGLRAVVEQACLADHAWCSVQRLMEYTVCLGSVWMWSFGSARPMSPGSGQERGYLTS